jgi:hypothetical protein
VLFENDFVQKVSLRSEFGYGGFGRIHIRIWIQKTIAMIRDTVVCRCIFTCTGTVFNFQFPTPIGAELTKYRSCGAIYNQLKIKFMLYRISVNLLLAFMYCVQLHAASSMYCTVQLFLCSNSIYLQQGCASTRAATASHGCRG